MEAASAEGGGSSDGIKDAARTKLKLNGDLNGSVEGMDVDADSHDSDQYQKQYSGDASNDSSTQVNNGEPTSGSEGEEEEDKTVKNEFHESMDIDGDGTSLNSEEEDNLLNSDAEKDERSSNKAHSESQDVDEETEEDEEEGDINQADDSGADQDGKPDKETNGETRSENGDGDTPEGHKTPKKKNRSEVTLTPRRSSRTVQKPVRFGQEDSNMESSEEGDDESDDIEEITPQDPLATHTIEKDIMRNIPRKIGNTTIVVSDTKRLADIAARNTNSQKKEPTLVIIDTNSILSGRGPVPVLSSQTNLQPPPQPAPQPQQPHHIKPYPGLPVAVPAQGLYPPKATPRPPPILPTLTDDMYVVEAPSFIVPYVYEKPPVKKFKKYLRKVLRQVRKQHEEQIRLEEEEDEAAEKEKEKEKQKEMKKEEAEVKKDGTEEEVKDKDKEKSDKDNEGEDKKESENDKDSDKSEVAVKEKDKESTNDNIEDSIKVNEIKREGGEVKVKVKETKSGAKSAVDAESSSDEADDYEEEEEGKKKPLTGGSYFDNPLGKFFMQIGMNLVQEFVQTDLLKQHKKKQKMGKGTEDTQAAINSLKKNLQLSKENNEPYNMEQSKCDYCSFKTESKLIMAHHLETPHMRNYVYRCNFCPLEVRGPHDILFHMEAEHNIRGRLERAPAFHQCPQCPFEDNQKGKLTRHLLTCGKKFRPEKNLEPPLDWEPPAKIPRVTRKPPNMPMNVNNPLYQQALASKNMQHPLLPKMVSALNSQQNALMRGRGRPNFQQVSTQLAAGGGKMMGQRALPPQLARASMVYGARGQQQMIMPSAYQISGNQLFQKNQAAVKLLNQPSISITPLPRQAPANSPSSSASAVSRQGAGSKTTFVICEICDGYIKDLEQLRNHMQWNHKVKIHPKMIYNRPPLNCQKCQFRFFTDQGLERHLLGSHGLVTSSMQDSANKGKDGGRCPVCGRVYQWKLLNHVARDHSMTLKPAHLSYKCTVCTATFGMYKQFENHVYSAHSVVAKRVMDKKNGQSLAASSSAASRADTASLLKPLKINDEITIIPQPAKKPGMARGSSSSGGRPRILQTQAGPSKQQALTLAAAAAAAAHTDSVQVIDLEDSPLKHGSENGGIESLTAVKERLRRRKSLEIRQVESEPDNEPEHEGHSEEESDATGGRSKVNSTNEDDDEEEEEGDGEADDERQRQQNAAEKENEEDDDEEDDEDEKEQREKDEEDEDEGEESDA